MSVFVVYESGRNELYSDIIELRQAPSIHTIISATFSGVFLKSIETKFENIPTRKDVHEVCYYGDMAKFIVSNI